MILVDTNVLAYFFNGNNNAGKIISENEIAISSLTYTEILSNKKLSKSQRQLVVEFLDSTFICHTNSQISNLAVSFCLTYNLKPMDAIIVATAKFLNVGFATADKELFKISEVPITRLII
ncbi:MAG: type II toxin-antitoxin system VapC family toxin [Chitinophagaceae bacterium]